MCRSKLLARSLTRLARDLGEQAVLPSLNCEVDQGHQPAPNSRHGDLLLVINTRP